MSLRYRLLYSGHIDIVYGRILLCGHQVHHSLSRCNSWKRFLSWILPGPPLNPTHSSLLKTTLETFARQEPTAVLQLRYTRETESLQLRNSVSSPLLKFARVPKHSKRERGRLSFLENQKISTKPKTRSPVICFQLPSRLAQIEDSTIVVHCTVSQILSHI